jgi:phosphoglycolate phosphatase
MAMIAPTIVYDVDGTLADTAEDLVATLNWLLGREGLAPLKVETAGSLLGAGARALIKRGFAASGKTLDPEATEALFADYLAYYSAHIAVHTRLYPGVDEALATFARAGWRQAICTNKIEGLAKLLVSELGIAERFAFICGQDTFGIGKPNATPLLKTIIASGGAKERAIMVGDSEIDIKTARAAGVPMIAVDFGYADVAVEELGPDRVISHFDQLMEACDALLVVADDRLTEPMDRDISAIAPRGRCTRM